MVKDTSKKGISAHQLHRYNWREMSDVMRTIKAIRGAEGKRLFYREPIK